MTNLGLFSSRPLDYGDVDFPVRNHGGAKGKAACFHSALENMSDDEASVNSLYTDYTFAGMSIIDTDGRLEEPMKKRSAIEKITTVISTAVEEQILIRMEEKERSQNKNHGADAGSLKWYVDNMFGSCTVRRGGAL